MTGRPARGAARGKGREAADAASPIQLPLEGMTADPTGSRPRSRGSVPRPPPPAEVEGDPVVEVRRSTRRRRTVSAYRDGERTVVLIPARMSRAEERRWVNVMLERLARQDRKLRPGDDELMARATVLSKRYLAGRARPASVRWVANQGSRWGSCTPADGTIRLSHRLQGMPGWVVDYVLVHELAHLLVPGHGSDFWEKVERYPRTERARGYLEGVSATAGLQMSEGGDNDIDLRDVDLSNIDLNDSDLNDSDLSGDG
jgi:predicted metal-dependent hydrolase